MITSKHIRRFLSTEWEIVVLAGLLALLLLYLLFRLLGGSGRAWAEGHARPLQTAPPQINHATAYAMLDDTAPPALPEDHLFNSGLPLFQEKKPVPPPAGRPRPNPPPVKPAEPVATQLPPPASAAATPQPAPAPTPTPTPPAAPPANPAAANWHILLYKGYRTTPTGTAYAVIGNDTTGEEYHLQQGNRLRGLMVMQFNETSLTLLLPNGRSKTVTTTMPMRFPAK